jgi:VanZ family protein
MLLGWMVFIFIKSNEPYQAQDIRPLLAEWFPHASLNNWLPHLEFYYSGALLSWKEPYVLLEFFFRKSAHVTEYAILTVLWFSNIHFTRLKRLNYFISPLIVILYAASDEWHQTFIAGRTGHAIDVAVDSIGILMILFLWSIWSWSIRNRNKGARNS